MELDTLRLKLDAINGEVIALLAKRLSLTKQVAEVKKRDKLPLLDEKREHLQYEKIREIAKAHGLNPDVIEGLFQTYIAYCKREMGKEME